METAWTAVHAVMAEAPTVGASPGVARLADDTGVGQRRGHRAVASPSVSTRSRRGSIASRTCSTSSCPTPWLRTIASGWTRRSASSRSSATSFAGDHRVVGHPRGRPASGCRASSSGGWSSTSASTSRSARSRSSATCSTSSRGRTRGTSSLFRTPRPGSGRLDAWRAGLLCRPRAHPGRDLLARPRHHRRRLRVVRVPPALSGRTTAAEAATLRCAS